MPQGSMNALWTAAFHLQKAGMPCSYLLMLQLWLTLMNERRNSMVTLMSSSKAFLLTIKIYLLGDFNVHIGTDTDNWLGVIQHNGVGKCNSKGLLLLSFSSEHQLTITNMIFRLPAKYKTFWQHPRSGHWHLFNYVITRQRDIQDINITCAYCGAECWMDHMLTVSVQS